MIVPTKVANRQNDQDVFLSDVNYMIKYIDSISKKSLFIIGKGQEGGQLVFSEQDTDLCCCIQQPTFSALKCGRTVDLFLGDLPLLFRFFLYQINLYFPLVQNKTLYQRYFVRKGKQAVFFKHLLALCASSPRASEGYQNLCLKKCIDCRCRVVLQCECACVLSDDQSERKNSRTGHT